VIGRVGEYGGDDPFVGGGGMEAVGAGQVEQFGLAPVGESQVACLDIYGDAGEIAGFFAAIP